MGTCMTNEPTPSAVHESGGLLHGTNSSAQGPRTSTTDASLLQARGAATRRSGPPPRTTRAPACNPGRVPPLTVASRHAHLLRRRTRSPDRRRPAHTGSAHLSVARTAADIVAPSVADADGQANATLGRARHRLAVASGRRDDRAAHVLAVTSRRPACGLNNSLLSLETQLVELARRGLSNAAIAASLVVSVRTVESHLYRARQKLGVSNRRSL